MNTNVPTLVPTKPERELAQEMKTEMLEAIKPFLDCCTRAKSAGFDTQITIASDMFGRVQVHNLVLIKAF